MHRTWKLDVKVFLHSGENQIRIVFRSVFKYIEDYEYEENKEIHYVPSGGMKGNQLILQEKALVKEYLSKRFESLSKEDQELFHQSLSNILTILKKME